MHNDYPSKIQIMITIQVSDEIRERCPEFVGAAVFADVDNSQFSSELWQEIDSFIDDYRSRYTIDSIKQMPSIEATRTAYRRCGKDPSRYRPSGEALVRRTLQGKELYRVNTLVDLINLASIAYGYSIGGFDADKIAPSSTPVPTESSLNPVPCSLSAGVAASNTPYLLTLGIGREGEPYEGIGRGPLNIAGLPVYRDAIGGIGTPTSDHERTKLSLQTKHLLTIVNGYDGNRQNTLSCAYFLQDLLQRFAHSDGGQIIEF
jgi:DNA/RNA-binding domain of Phe-tRNA-synthetase-like protein